MKKSSLLLTITCSVCLILATACSSNGVGESETESEATATTQSATPDPCAQENIIAEVEKVHAIMRAFDDAANLAARTPHSQLAGMISPLQDLRRQAEDLPVPYCLNDLKGHQLTHMNVVIETMMAFLGGADLNVLNAGIAQARQLHEQYNMELAVLIGATYVPPPTVSPSGGTASATETTEIQPPFVSNVGDLAVNLRASPDVNAGSPGQLEVGASTSALGQTADGLWILVEIPGQPGETAWLYAPLVEVTGLELLNIVEP